MSDFVDTVVVGAGVVGLAIARELSESADVMVFDKESHIGSHTSSRNSEVIHAGIYYPADSNKARLCVDGKHRLYDYCARRGVPHRRTGKLIVACSDDEEEALAGYITSASANGVDDLAPVTLDAISKMEPQIRCTAGVLSPSTGIVDSHALMVAMLGEIEAMGGQLVLGSNISRVRVTNSGFALDFDDDHFTLACRRLVNSAGLWAQNLAAQIDAMPASAIPPQFFAKAHYYSLSGRSPFQRLVYPLAGAGGLGVHVTIDLAGQARFGPDVRWVDMVDYTFDDSRRSEFCAAIQRYYPSLDVTRLVPGYTGIRPKLVGVGEPAADFVIQGPSVHGVDGLVNLFGIESPGLTASLAIGADVRALYSDAG